MHDKTLEGEMFQDSYSKLNTYNVYDNFPDYQETKIVKLLHVTWKPLYKFEATLGTSTDQYSLIKKQSNTLQLAN